MSKNILLLHGALGSGDQFISLKELLKAKGYSVHILTFSGHGTNEFLKNFGIAHFGNELKEFILQRNLPGVNVFAYSMGGFVTLYLASREPNLIGNIMTLGTKFGWNQETSHKEVKNLDPVLIENKVPKYAEKLRSIHGEKWKELLHRTAQMMLELGTNNPLGPDEFKRINNKVRLGIADKDKMVSVEETRNVLHLLPNAEMYMLPGTQHPYETANEELLCFLIEDLFV